jgi:LPXTG-site transpeptidase (sortase) family protein
MALPRIGGKRRIYLGIGGIALVAGVALLAVGLMSTLGGGDDRPDIQVVALTDTPTPAPTTLAEDKTPGPPPLGEKPYEMVIDKIGVDAPVQAFGLDDQQVPLIPTGDDAAQVVAWYNFSAQPGTGSNAVFAGHVTWFGEAVFFNLSSLVAGDQIKLKGTDGTELLYAVSDVFAVDENDPNGRDVMFGTPDDVITIITCDGTFIPDPNDHVAAGHYAQRAVVRAKLQSVTPGAGAGAG